MLCSNAGAGEIPTRPAAGAVVVATNNWASQVVGAHVVKSLLEKTGHAVELKPTAIDLQLAALGEGELHVQAELRESVMGEALDRAVKSRRVMRAGNHAARSREGWWYPDYVQALCPGLPDWQALRGCAGVFGAAGPASKGRFLAGPKAWKHRDEERTTALALPLQVVNADSADALLRELEWAVAAKKPILMFRWSPHWMDLVHPGRFVEFPAFDPNCVTDPAWGPNPNAIYDCDLYKASAISKAVWAKLPREKPCAFEVVKRVSFTATDLAAMEEMVAARKLSSEEAAQRWLDANEARWRRWLPNCRARR